MARPKTRPAPGDAERVERLAVGCSEGTCAAACNVSPATFKRWLRDEPRIAEAYRKGRETEETALVQSLYRAATDAKRPNITAAIFLLKTRHRYIDQPQLQLPENRVEVTFQLPAPLSRDQYRKLIDVAPTKALRQAEADAG